MATPREELIEQLIKESEVAEGSVRRVLNGLAQIMSKDLESTGIFNMPSVGPLIRAGATPATNANGPVNPDPLSAPPDQKEDLPLAGMLRSLNIPTHGSGHGIRGFIDGTDLYYIIVDKNVLKVKDVDIVPWGTIQSREGTIAVVVDRKILRAKDVTPEEIEEV